MGARRVGVERQGMVSESSSVEDVFACLGDRQRLHILSLLLRRPACVFELVEAMDLQQPTVSHHLAQMRAAGLVIDFREPPDRRWVRYAVNREALERLRDAVGLWVDRAVGIPRGDLPPRLVARSSSQRPFAQDPGRMGKDTTAKER